MKMRLFFCLGLITLLLVCGIADATPVLTFQWSVPSTVGIKGAQHAAVDSSGNVYVTDTGNQSVWKFASDGTLITTWGAPGTDDGQFNNPSYITVNQSGYVYVVDDGNTRIEEFTSDGTYVRQWGSSGSDPGQFHSITGIATDPNGNVSVVDNRYWSEQNRVEIFDPSGTFLTQFGSNGGGSGTFTNPYGIAADASGDWYVADWNLELVQQFYNNGTYRAQWGNPGTPGSDHGAFHSPSDIALDASGDIYILDTENYRVEKFHSDMSYSETYSLETTDYSPTGLGVAGDGSVYVTINGAVRKYSSAGTLLFTNNAAGSGNGEFNHPSGIAVNATGYIYVTDTYNNRTQRFDPNGAYLSQGGSPGSGNGQFNNPLGIATDTSGKVYIVDVGNRRIQVFDPSGNYLDQWPITATYTNSYVGADHVAFDPLVIAVDPDGNIYVGERCSGWGVGQIEKFDSGHTSINITSTGWGVPDGGDPTPTGITVGPDGFVYASIRLGRIDKFYSNGTFVTQWGSQGTGNGQFDGPTGIAVDSEGLVYVIDGDTNVYVPDNNRIQLFDSEGNYWLTWGSYGTGNGQFDYPEGIATDTSGNIYVVDRGNERIQKFLRSGTSTIVPVPQFSSQVTAGSIPFTVQFTDTSIGVPASWSWDFGDANTTNATLQNPVHTYNTPGKYSVTLSATNADGTNATTKTDYIWAMYPIPNTTWQRSLGGSSSDGAKKILQTSDGGYIVAGYSYSNDGNVTANYGNDDYWIVKLDSSGAITWQKSLGGSGYDEAKSIAQTSDGGYIVAGASKSTDGNVTGNHGDYDAWVVKLDSSGTITWQKSYGGLSSDGANKIAQASDGGYIFAGYSNSNDGNVTGNHGNSDYWVVKLDSSGALTWQKSLGGSGDDSANDIIQTSDGGYIIAGYSNSNDGNVTGNHGNGDYWIVKLDSSGAITWQKSLGGSSHDNAYSIAQTSDGGYIVAGWTNSNDGNVTTNHGDRDCWVVKLTSSGGITWQKSLGSSAGDEVYSVAQTTDGGYILAGYSASNDGDVTVNYGMDDYWIIKLDSSGTISWQKPLGGSSYDDAYSIAQTSDGGYIVAGQSASSDGDIAHPLGDSDYWILKLGGSSGGSSTAPVASFTANVTSGTAPLAIQFKDTSTNSPTAWNWSFGDGTPVSTLQNPAHPYSFAGTYRVSLNATNTGGSSTTSQYVFVDFASASMFRGNRSHTGLFDDNGIRPTANLKWKVSTLAAVGSSPVIANGILYIGSNDGKIYAINASTGGPVWNTSIGTNIESTPAIADDIVYIGSWDKNVYARDAATGSSIWTYATGDYITSSPAVVNGIVYIGSNDGKLYALNATNGIPYWIYTAASSIGSSPAVANGIVYVGSSPSAIQALNATTGSVIWANTSLAGGVVSSPTVAEGVVYVGSNNNRIYAMDASTGSPLWQYMTTDNVASSPAVSNDVVYIGCDDKNIYAIGATNGTKLWNYATSGAIKSSPSVANGRVYIGSNDNTLYVLNSISGSLIQQYTTSGAVRSSPWIANGTVYFGSDDFSVYALGGSAAVAPVASFTTNVTSGTAPLAIQFNDTSTNSPTAWNWSFGDGNYSIGQNPTHIYSTLGRFTVSLTAANTGGSNTNTQTNYLSVSDIRANFTWSCNATVPYRVDFHNTSTTGYPPIESLWWYFGDGDSDLPETVNPMHTYTNTSSMNVTLKAWDLLGVESDISKMVTPCSITPAVNGTIINQSATLFIGEEGLNLTHALNQAAGTPNINGVPYFTTIGWWPSSVTPGSTAPQYSTDLNSRYKSMLVDPDTFVGRTGAWYLLDSDKNPIKPAIFTVADPSLDIRVWDFDRSTDVTGSSVTLGTRLGFRVDTNLNQMVNNRSPLNYATDGFIDIAVKNESGATLTTLYNDSTSTGAARAGPHSLLANYVNTQPFYWGAPSGYSWATNALTGSTNIYPPGTYTVTATSTLHNMLNNYKTTGGAAYTGKTISPARTVILASKPAPVVSFTEDVTNGTVPFTVQFTGSAAETPTAWNWSFGDGNYSNLQNPTYLFVAPKVHNVTLTATFSSILSNSTMQQITGYAAKVATTSAVNGTTSSTVAGNQTMIVNTSAITETGGTVTTSGNTITITGANTFWQSTQIQAASIATNETPGNVTVANVNQVVMQSAPVTASLNQTFTNVSVALDVALKQYVPDADVNITITQGATTDTTHAFQLAAQNASQSIADIAYTVQFSNTELINSNLTTNAARTSTAVVLNMSVNHTWVVHFDTGSNNYGRDAIAIIRYPEAGDPQSLPTRFVAYDAATNLDWFNTDSKYGLSIFGMVGYAAQQAAAQQAAPPSGSLVRSTPQAIDTANPNTVAPDKTQNQPTAAPTPAATKPPAPAIPAYMTSAPLKNDATGKLSATVKVKTADSAALLSLPQGTKPTDSAGHTLSEVSINTMDSSTIPPAESSTYTFSGLAYQCSPDGARFNPPITISFTPSEDQWNTLISSGSRPVIRTYSSSTGTWQSLPTTTDTTTHTVTAPVSHFSTYALFSEPANSTSTPASLSSPSSSVSAPSATPKSTAKPPANALEIMINLGSWCLDFISKNLFLSLAAITAVILASVGWSRYRRKKRFDTIMYKR